MRCRVRPRLPILAALALFPARAPLHSQTTATATVDAAATRLFYDGDVEATGISLTPNIQVLRPWQALLASGTWTRFGDGAWSMQGRLDVSALLPSLAGIQPELAPRASGTRHQDGGGTGELGGAVRLHLLRDLWAFWVGAGGGRAWNGLAWRTVRSAETGAWARIGSGTATLLLSVADVDSEIDYGDAEIAYRLDSGPLELSAYAGARRPFGSDAAGTTGWGGASAAWWMTDRIAVTAGVGAYPADVAEGLPRGAFGALGLRVATGRVPHTDRAYGLRNLRTRSPVRGAALDARRDGDEVVLTLRGVPASRIELMGDLTAWSPVELQQDGDRWTLRLAAQPGVYRVNLRRDGGEWTVPPATTRALDEFGGVVGILVID